jgi:hypothetical protein
VDQPSNKKPWLVVSQGQTDTNEFVIFGGLAVVVTFVTVDPWLCVAGFRRVCLYRMFLIITIAPSARIMQYPAPYSKLADEFRN